MNEESSLVSNVWTQRSLGLDLSKRLTTASPSDVEYICNYFYPFLQLVNVDAVFSEEAAINFIVAASGWVIHDYGDAISTSAQHKFKVEHKGEVLAKSQTEGKAKEAKQESKDEIKVTDRGKEVEGDKKEKKGKDRKNMWGDSGLIRLQIMTVEEIANLIAVKGWVAAELIAGTKMMQRLIWIESQRYKFEIKGYAATMADEKCCEQLRKHLEANKIAWEKKPVPLLEPHKAAVTTK